MYDPNPIQSYLSTEEFENYKFRLTNILVLNQYRLYLDKKVEIERRKNQSLTCGSLCIDRNDLPHEIWLEYNKGNIMVSSYGRVKYDKEIVLQKDEIGKIGWLVLENEKSELSLQRKYVFHMVAETFFKKPAVSGYQVHHISNNGYDNSIGNLIYLTKEQHTEVEKPIGPYKRWQ